MITGSFNRFSADVTYGYHIGLTATTNQAGGFSAGITRIGLDRSKIDFSGTGDPNNRAAFTAYSDISTRSNRILEQVCGYTLVIISLGFPYNRSFRKNLLLPKMCLCPAHEN
jgi:hypothetical protein